MTDRSDGDEKGDIRSLVGDSLHQSRSQLIAHFAGRIDAAHERERLGGDGAQGVFGHQCSQGAQGEHDIGVRSGVADVVGEVGDSQVVAGNRGVDDPVGGIVLEMESVLAALIDAPGSDQSDRSLLESSLDRGPRRLALALYPLVGGVAQGVVGRAGFGDVVNGFGELGLGHEFAP